MTMCARPGCDDAVIPAIDPRYCSRECRFTHLHPELTGVRSGTAEWSRWWSQQVLPCLNSRCVCGDAG